MVLIVDGNLEMGKVWGITKNLNPKFDLFVEIDSSPKFDIYFKSCVNDGCGGKI